MSMTKEELYEAMSDLRSECYALKDEIERLKMELDQQRKLVLDAYDIGKKHASYSESVNHG